MKSARAININSENVVDTMTSASHWYAEDVGTSIPDVLRPIVFCRLAP